MIQVAFLGDSIRMQYAPKVGELLGEEFSIFSSGDNGRYAKYTLRCLYDWQGDMAGSRIVHWNNGLWDSCELFGDGALFTSEEEYEATMLRIADILLSRYDRVIFATTTPVSPKNTFNKNEDIKRYNDRIVPLLRARGVWINDLYSLVAQDLDAYICEDTIHLSEAGIACCAQAVTEVIRQAAQQLT